MSQLFGKKNASKRAQFVFFAPSSAAWLGFSFISSNPVSMFFVNKNNHSEASILKKELVRRDTDHDRSIKEIIDENGGFVKRTESVERFCCFKD